MTYILLAAGYYFFDKKNFLYYYIVHGLFPQGILLIQNKISIITTDSESKQ